MPQVPLFPLPMVAFPGESIALHIFEPRYKEMITLCLEEKRPFCIVCAEDSQMHRVGTLVAIKEVTQTYDDGKRDIKCSGLTRVEVLRVITKKAFYEADIIPFEDIAEPEPEPASALSGILSLYDELMQMASQEAGHEPPPTPDDAFGFAQYVGFDLAQKQELLELRSETLRLSMLQKHLNEVVPRIKAYEKVKNRIIANGHFRKYPPVDLNL